MPNAGYQWMTIESITDPTRALGNIVGGTGYNDVSVTITHSGGGMANHVGVVGYSNFPSQIGGVNVNIPDIANQIKNVQAGTFTAVFDKPVTNILVAFGSVGQPGTQVPVQVSVPFTPLWGIATTYQNPVGATQYSQFIGEEGYNIIRLDGTLTEVTFLYTVSENYCTMSFGFEDQNDSQLGRCNPIFQRHARGSEDGCVRFRRLRHLGYV